MDTQEISDLVDALHAEHTIMIEKIALVQRAMDCQDAQVRTEIMHLHKILKNHFFHEDMELFPVLLTLFRASGQDQGGWGTGSNGRDVRSELLRFSKLSLQVFEVISEFLQTKPPGYHTTHTRMQEILHLLGTRIDYEEKELFPTIQERIRLGC